MRRTLLTRGPYPRRWLIALGLALGVGCGSSGPPADERSYADACTAFCENGYDCLGDPEGRRGNCRSSCEPIVPPADECGDAAVRWVRCLADIDCEQLVEPGATEVHCGAEHAEYEARCAEAADGGAGG